jgi:heptosyltransferase-2
VNDPQKIIVRGPNWLGDLVMSTPGFRALRARFPDARIALHVRPQLARLVDGAPWFDEVLPLRSYHAGARALFAEARSLRQEGYDLGVCIPESWSSALLLRAAGVRRRIGYGEGAGRWLFTDRVPVPPEWGRRRLVARERFVLQLVGNLGCATDDPRIELFTTPSEESRANALLRDEAVGDRETLVALAPGASYGPSKLWPTESFARVGDAAHASGVRVAIVGSPAEAALVHSVSAAMERPGVELAEAMDVGVLKAVLKRCQVLVCNDAGARHVAAALGVPSIVLMGPTSLEKTDMNLERVQVLATDVECRPCYERVCPIDHRCMTRLSPESVSRAMLALIGPSVPNVGEPRESR